MPDQPKPDASTHRRLLEVGLAVDFSADWPIQGTASGGHGMLYQFVADTTGVVFVRYDRDDTVDHYLSQLGDMLTRATIERDESVTHHGQPARRVRVLLHRRSVERLMPEERNIIVVTGFAAQGMPVLAGYRMPEAALSAHRAALDAIVDSVKPIE